MGGSQVLVVDDEAETRRLLRDTLEQEGYRVVTANSGEEALRQVETAPPDLLVLDLVLPDMSGLEFCRMVREWSEVPIIAVSAQTEERTKVETLDQGADAYLTKPFGLGEFLARVRGVLRRAGGAIPSPILEEGDVRLDQVRQQVTLRGREVPLTPREFEVLRYLMAHAGQVINHRKLLAAVWGESYVQNTETLRVFIAQLRRKIEPRPERPRYIHTVARVGYCFQSQP
jgi:two-component system, OmpR family, KDP operon response regulator KdpE